MRTAFPQWNGRDWNLRHKPLVINRTVLAGGVH
jgi:hypothetical protein